MRSRRRARIRRTAAVAVLGVLGVLPGVSAAAPPEADASPGAQGRSRAGDLAIEVVSSPPQYVSGGDARVVVHLPDGVTVDDVEVTLDGIDVTGAFTASDDGMEGVVDGLPPGEAELAARLVAGSGPGGRRVAVTVINHPLEGPVFSGEQQQPFGCTTEGDLDETGVAGGPRLHEADPADGCAMDMLVSWLYRPAGATSGFAHYDLAAPPSPAEIATTTTIDGEERPFVVRWERGTINRFVHSIAMLAPPPTAADLVPGAAPDLSAWNERLIYHFQGGVGIGHYQGEPDDSRMLYEFGLANGYAVAYSTGTRAGVHYDLVVGGETAIMVKDRFVSAYGEPRYTVGVGGSGGAIQQYVYGQNHPGLIDAAIPQYSYPDMITQTIHVGDCELLERWMDHRVMTGAPDAPQWADWDNRSLLEGLNAENGAHVATFWNTFLPWMPPGSSECISGWRGLSPLALNPHYGDAPGVDQTAVEWTHFADAINVYGINPDGFANRTWDNRGVQYGLQALLDGDITPEQFLDLNWNVGSWKNEPDMVQEGCPFIQVLCSDPAQVDPWSQRNMALATGDAPAPRATADPGAVEAAYTSGMVFRGDLEIPVIDWRHYLEPWLDMHNSHQSFASRQRMLDHDGDASNQVVWFTMGARSGGDRFDQTPMAFRVMDEWMANIAAHPDRGVGGNRPAGAEDSCFDVDGQLLHRGADAWAGVLDDGAAGPCTEAFPIHSTSRIVAGAPITGDVFVCERQPVRAAVARGVYGSWTPSTDQLATLEQVFPEGVCDHRKGDARRPASL